MLLRRSVVRDYVVLTIRIQSESPVAKFASHLLGRGDVLLHLIENLVDYLLIIKWGAVKGIFGFSTQICASNIFKVFGYLKWLVILVWALIFWVIRVLDAVVIRIVILLTLFHEWCLLLHPEFNLPVLTLLHQFYRNRIHILGKVLPDNRRLLHVTWINKDACILPLKLVILQIFLLDGILIRIVDILCQRVQALKTVPLDTTLMEVSLRRNVTFECRLQIYLAHSFETSVVVHWSAVDELSSPLLRFRIHQFDFVREGVQLRLESEIKCH